MIRIYGDMEGPQKSHKSLRSGNFSTNILSTGFNKIDFIKQNLFNCPNCAIPISRLAEKYCNQTAKFLRSIGAYTDKSVQHDQIKD